MDEQLRVLFLAKGLGPSELAAVQAADGTPQTVDDLAAGAESEADARTWAEELGLTARVGKSRFVQSWLEARRLLREAVEAKPPETPEKPEKPERPSPQKSSEAVAGRTANPPSLSPESQDEGWQVVRTASPEPRARSRAADTHQASDSAVRLEAGGGGSTASSPGRKPGSTLLSSLVKTIVPRGCPLQPDQEETFSKPGGISDDLRRLLRASSLTAVETAALEASLEPRTCRDLAASASSAAEAMRLAREAGINSKVSQENFANAWYECVSAIAVIDPHVHIDGDKECPLHVLAENGDFEACTDLLAEWMKVPQKQDLLLLVRGLLDHLAEKHRLLSEPQGHGKNSKVLPVLAAAYGGDIAERLRRRAEVDEADWRWRWRVRSLCGARTATALQQQLLKAYQADTFQDACRELNREWSLRASPPSLEQKMREIEALCLDRVLVHLLPAFGFAADPSGAAEMKAAITQHKNNAEVKQLQVEISAAVMARFRL